MRTRGDLASLPPRYAVAARVVKHVLSFEPLPLAAADAAQREFGVEGLLELVVLAGYYRRIAGVLFSFDVPLPAGRAPPF